MQAYMNIRVQVMSAQAQAQIKALQAQVAALQKQTASAGATSAAAFGGGKSLAGLRKFGNQLQWSGRMLQYNFTLPLLLAGGAATKFALDQEKAMTRVAKVYGDTTDATRFWMKTGLSANDALAKSNQVFRQELDALNDSFVAMSNRYGVAASEVMNVAGAWAAAGASGEQLARSVDTTMKAMILGELSAADATDALIAIQAQYNLNSKQLVKTLAQLNAIENQTGIQTKGLIQGFARSASVAREAGISTRYLGAMLAALVPATGTASQAGNALKTIISRLLAPTQEASQVINEMGFNVQSTAWQSATAAERIQMLADKWETMNGAARGAASAVIASRWQITKFEQLMEELTKRHGFYQKALDATSSRTQIFATMNKELNAVLNSSPARLEATWRQVQNGMATAIQPLIPYILWLATSIADLVNSFQKLDPEMQKLILVSLLAVAALGPLLRYLGALKVILWAVLTAFIGVGGVLGKVFANIVAAAWWMVSGVVGAFTSMGGMIVRGIMLLPTALVYLGGAALMIAREVGLVSMALVRGLAFSYGFLTTIVPAIVTALTGFWPTVVTVWTAAVGTLNLLWGALLLGAQVGITRVLGAIIAFGASTVGITTGFWGTIWAIQARASSIWIGLVTTLSGGLSTIWAMMYLRLAAISAAFSGGLTTLWAAMQTRLFALSAMLGGRMTALWTVMHAGWLGITGRFWSGMVRLWIIGWTMLQTTTWKAIATNLKWFAMLYRGPILIVTAALAAIIGVAYHFRDELTDVWNGLTSWLSRNTGDAVTWIIKAWNMLPQGVANAITGVLEIVKTVALQVYEWMSYLNPFARHSPSLVENVTNGLGEVKGQFASLKVIGGYLKGTYKDINAFGKAIAGLNIRARAFEMQQDRMDLKKFAPQALPAWDRLATRLRTLEPMLAKVEQQMKGQQAVVDAWQAKVDKVNKSLDVQKKRLDDLQAVADAYRNKLDEAQQRLTDYANAPLVGMQDMENQIRANEMAQNRLNLEILKMEQVYGTFDELKSKIDAVNGAQELLRGEQNSLRMAGAGSEITSQYDAQIKALDKQKDKYGEAADKIDAMQVKLKALEMEGRRLDLTKHMKFDELQYQIEAAANVMKREMTFDEIISGIQQAQSDISLYSGKLEEANRPLKAQQAIVDAITAKRDQLQGRLDKEQESLDKIKDRYDAIKGAVDDINSAMDIAIQNANKLEQAKKAKKGGKDEYVTPGLQNFRDAMKFGGDFPEVGGSGALIRKNWQSQADEIQKITDDLAKQTGDMFKGLNPFGPVKEYWNKFKAWFMPGWDKFSGWVQDVWGKMWTALGSDKAKGVFSSIGDAVRPVGDIIRDVVDQVIKWGGRIWRLFGPEVKKTFNELVKGGKKFWKELGPVFESFGDLIKPAGEALQNMWTIAKPILAWILLRFLAMGKIIWSTINGALGPAIDLVIDVIKSAYLVIRGLVKLIIGIFTLDFGMIGSAVWDIINGLFGGIIRLIWNFIKVVGGAIKGFVKGVIGFFVWLWDELVGHSIVPDIVEGIKFWFHKLIDIAQWIWDHTLGPIIDFFKEAWTKVRDNVKGWWTGLRKAWSNIKDGIAGWWNKHIWNPVKEAITGWWNERIRVWKSWWKAIQDAWNNIKTGVTGWWNKSVWNPLKNLVSDWWQGRLRVWKGWWADIKAAWSNIKSGDWWNNHVMQPIKDAITKAWTSIKNWFSDNKDTILKPINNVINSVITAVNWMIKGLNKISDILPGIDFHIDVIPKLATGGEIPGRRVGGGFMTKGARAIVGEGKQNYPEFVIPTDPTYRSRARGLLAMAAKRLGHGEADLHGSLSGRMKNGIPHYDIGGMIGGVGDLTKSAWKKIKSLPKNAVTAAFKPMRALAQDKIDKVDWALARGIAQYGLDKVTEWVTGANKGLTEKMKAADKKYSLPTGGNVAVSDPSNPKGHTYWRGGEFSNRFAAHLQRAEQIAKAQINVMQGGFRPATSYSGTSHRGDAIDLQVNKALIVALRRVGIAAGDRTGLGSWAPHVHAVPGPSAGYGAGSAPWQWQDYMARGGMNQPLDSPWGLQNGAIIRRTAGGVLARIGEGRHDEAVTPLPPGWQQSLFSNKGGDTIIEINGNLEFPNITSGEDAEEFIENLIILVKE